MYTLIGINIILSIYFIYRERKTKNFGDTPKTTLLPLFSWGGSITAAAIIILEYLP